MRSVDLLEQALTKNPKSVLDVGVGNGAHSMAFIANGATRVVGVDPREKNIEHNCYEHKQDPYEQLDLGDEKFDMVWCSHTLEHIPNVQHFLIHLRAWLKPDGWLAISVPSDKQQRVHIGHLTLWTPAHLVYNLICAGWDCKEAIWYTRYLSIGLLVQKFPDIDLSWRTSLPSEHYGLNSHTPKYLGHNDGAWWGNRWPVEFDSERPTDPPMVTLGIEHTNIPPKSQLAFGPNPAFRKEPGTWT